MVSPPTLSFCAAVPPTQRWPPGRQSRPPAATGAASATVLDRL